MINDNVHRYGTVTRVLHWAVGALVIWQLLKLADWVNDGENWVSLNLVKPFHSSIGLIIFVLALVRLIWAIRQRALRPAPLKFVRAAKAGHHLLYVLMILTPLSAICLMLGKGYGLKLFGHVLVERGATSSEALAALGSLHAPLACFLTLMVVGHIAMVLYHRLVLKDKTLQRMLGK